MTAQIQTFCEWLRTLYPLLVVTEVDRAGRLPERITRKEFEYRLARSKVTEARYGDRCVCER